MRLFSATVLAPLSIVRPKICYLLSWNRRYQNVYGFTVGMYDVIRSYEYHPWKHACGNVRSVTLYRSPTLR